MPISVLASIANAVRASLLLINRFSSMPVWMASPATPPIPAPPPAMRAANIAASSIGPGMNLPAIAVVAIAPAIPPTGRPMRGRSRILWVSNDNSICLRVSPFCNNSSKAFCLSISSIWVPLVCWIVLAVGWNTFACCSLVNGTKPPSCSNNWPVSCWSICCCPIAPCEKNLFFTASCSVCLRPRKLLLSEITLSKYLCCTATCSCRLRDW